MDKFVYLPLGLLVFSILYKIFPPKKINIIYGYRTKRSMKSQEIWNESNRYAANAMILVGAIASIVTLVFRFIIHFPQGLRYSGLIVLVGLVATIPIVEIHLKRNFDESGNRKRKESNPNEH